ncbi:hypothetical protein ACPUER_36875, partial [Burkholderia sp. DN3021]|uniref:hypothetical protein n=1 Tax=Burkholderia sp. DN3021 TaxID=3410137 RepID=UPI003C7AB535
EVKGYDTYVKVDPKGHKQTTTGSDPQALPKKIATLDENRSELATINETAKFLQTPAQKKRRGELEKAIAKQEKAEVDEARKAAKNESDQKSPEQRLADKKIFVKTQYPDIQGLIDEHRLALTQESALKSNAYYLAPEYESSTSKNIPFIEYDGASKWYRAMTKSEYDGLRKSNQFSQSLDGYGGISPSYDYVYKNYFSPANTEQKILVEFSAVKDGKEVPLSGFLHGKISQPKVEDGAISIGLGSRGTPGIGNESGEAGRIFNELLLKGNITYHLIGVNVKTSGISPVSTSDVISPEVSK